ncbi:hypothetical protein [Roseateles saccharophilus]|nr:hypothetical protein [Roseateles saccharophilus]
MTDGVKPPGAISEAFKAVDRIDFSLKPDNGKIHKAYVWSH